jgi:hypothetical protein
MANGFAASVAYTGSIRRNRSNFDPFLPAAEAERYYYTANGSRPHNLVISYNYLAPDVSRLWNNVIIRGALDGWQVSGITTLQSGTRTGFSSSFTGAPFNDMTGGPGGSRVTLLCDPTLPRVERTIERQFKTECIGPPGPRSDSTDIYYLGRALSDEWVAPGYMNHDLTLFKNFRMRRGSNLQVRVEMYNAFSVNQFTGLDTSAQFNFATGAQTDANFGRVTGTRSGSQRIIQLCLRYTF